VAVVEKTKEDNQSQYNKVWAYFLPVNPIDISKTENLQMLQVTTFETVASLLSANKGDEAIKLLMADSLERRFEESNFKDPVLAIEAFIRSVDFGVYPPRSVLVWLCKSFKKYIEEKGEYSFEDILGFSNGKHNPYLKKETEYMRVEAVMERASLVSLMNIKPSMADVIVSSRFSVNSPKTIKNWVSTYRKQYDQWIEFFMSREKDVKIKIMNATFDRLKNYDIEKSMAKAIRRARNSSP